MRVELPDWRRFVLHGEEAPSHRDPGISLDLSRATLDRGAWARLCSLGALVRSLVLARCQLGDGDLPRLGWLPALERLDLSDNPITDDGLAALGQLAGLGELALARTAVTGRGLGALPPSLRELELRGAPVDTTEGLRSLPALRALHLDGRSIGDAHLEPLAALRLDTLGLGGTAVTGAGLDRLPSSLRRLDLAGSSLDDGGAENLPWSRAPLLRLDVSHTAITDVGVHYLASVLSLDWLSLAGTRVTEDGLRALAPLRRLSRLELQHTPLDERDLAPLAPMARLRELFLCGRRIPATARDRLKHALPSVGPLRIEVCDLAGHRACVGVDACVVPVLEVAASPEEGAARAVGTGVYVLMPGTTIEFADGRHPVVKSGDLRVLTPVDVAERAAPAARGTSLAPEGHLMLKPVEPRTFPGDAPPAAPLVDQVTTNKPRGPTRAGARRDGKAREVTLWSHVEVTLRAGEPVVVISCRLVARDGDAPVGLVQHEATVTDASDEAARLVLDTRSDHDLLGAGVFATRDGALALAGMVVAAEGAALTVATRRHLEAAARRG